MPGAAITVKLKSTKSAHYYTTRKNPKNVTKKLELNRYDPNLRKHVTYKEEKIK